MADDAVPLGAMSDHIYFSGDPAQDSARRHLERVLSQPQTRRWPFLAALFASGTAFTVWRMRKNQRNRAKDPDRNDGPDRNDAGTSARPPR
jgi:hypothetical protein